MVSIEIVTLDLERFNTPHSIAPMRLANYLLVNSRQEHVDINPLISTYPLREGGKDIAEKIVRNKPDIIGLPGYIWTIDKSAEVSNYIHTLSPQTLVVVGGPEIVLPTNLHQEKWNGSEYFVSGEGESPLYSLVKAFAGGNINNMQHPSIYRLGDKRRVQPNLMNTLEIPSMFTPEFMDLFKDEGLESKWLMWETSRGCFYDCGFCDHKISSTRIMNPDVIESEIKRMATLGIEGIFIVDPIAGGKRKEGMSLFQMLNQFLPAARIEGYMRPELLNEEYIKILSESNIRMLQFGIQSLNENVPILMRRNSVELIKKYLPLLSKNNIPWRADLIIGLPGDDEGGLRASLKTTARFQPTEFFAYPLTVLHGTPLETSMLDSSDHPYTERGQEYWIERDPLTLRATKSSSYNREQLEEMKRYGAFFTGVYMAEMEERWSGFRTPFDIEEIERRVQRMLNAFTSHLPEKNSQETLRVVKEFYRSLK